MSELAEGEVPRRARSRHVRRREETPRSSFIDVSPPMLKGGVASSPHDSRTYPAPDKGHEGPILRLFPS